jgi:folate-binding protein YgfZ
MSKPFYVKLRNRGLVHIEGEDRKTFLQGLVSNDVMKVAMDKAVYACFLTPQGKFLHDFFILEGDGFLLLDCEGCDRARDLYERLLKYRLRSKVALSVEESHEVYAVLPPTPNLPLCPSRFPPAGGGVRGGDGKRIEVKGIEDPRHVDLGYRAFEKPADLEEKPFEEWDRLRISLTVPDGSRDMEIERSTLLECNIDRLNGIDWDKGCYMGQELTARTHYRGLVKKHLYTVQIDGEAPPPFSDLPDGVNMRSSCGDIGLVLMRDDLNPLPAGFARFPSPFRERD